VGFIGPFTCGATVVHLRTLRPEFIREAFTRYKINYMTVVPMLLKMFERSLRQRFDELPRGRRKMLNGLIRVNRAFTRRKPRPKLSKRLLPQIHKGFGGELRALFVGGAFTEPATLQFFYNLGVLVGNGYGCTEAGTVITLNDFKPFRADTVGKPLPGTEVRIANPDAEGVGEVIVRSKTVMSHYLDDPEMTAETLVGDWLITGDLGRIDTTGHLQLLGRKKNMIVTEEGKNIYPEDVEAAFEGLAVKEFCVFAANYIWPERTMTGEMLVLVLHPDARPESAPPLGEEIVADLSARNRRLLNYKRVGGYFVWDHDFPRTASMKIKRAELAEQIRQSASRDAVVSV
jgi:long-chain acyl-CoA synthetase